MGSSFLGEVLGPAGDEFLPEVNSKVNEIVRQISAFKGDVKNIFGDGFINFSPFLKENELLKTKTQALTNDVNAIQGNISNDIKLELSNCTIDLKNLSASLLEVNLSLKILNQLLEIHYIIKDAHIKMKNKQFYECAALVINIQQIIKNDKEALKELEIFRTLSQEAVLLYEQLLHEMTEIWSYCVCFKIEQLSNSTLVTLSIDTNCSEEISQILKALCCLQDTVIERKFSSKLINCIMNEVILKEADITNNNDEKAVLTVEILKNTKKPHYTKVFENLIKVILFIKKHLNVEIEKGHNFIFNIGHNVAKEFTDNLIMNCLSETIPTNSDDLERYNEVVNNAEEFQTTLHESGFLPQDCSSLIDYAKNINVLFANKFCQSYLDRARIIMKKDLHNITSSEEIVLDQLSALPPVHCNILRDKLNRMQDEVVAFPKCQISKSAEELLNLVQTIMDEVVKSQDLCAVRLFYTVRNIFEMYAAVVPLHHKKFLETLPQQVAIFHNNCMYFTHHLIKLTCQYKKVLPQVLKEHFSILLEEAIVLRSLATESLEIHVSSQRNQLVYILRDSGLATLNEEPKLNPNTEKSVRQCLRQLQILQSVWQEVLPGNVYTKAIGFLVDACIEELITLILNVEDISSDTASDLVSVFTVVLNRAPSLFLDPLEINRHTNKWQRFKEFVHVLKGSLRDIDVRWSDGMGPLANEFPAEQVKHMIRALFQNSERRAALLSRIK